LTAEKALGIKEISDFLNGRINVEKAEEELKKNTRRYAKRQLTWFRGDKRVVWIDADRDAGEIAEDIMEKMSEDHGKSCTCYR
jgi:tRNA dimethylallyltransferase